MLIRLARPSDSDAMGRVLVDTYLAAHRDHMPEAAWRKRKEEWTPEVSARSWQRVLNELEQGIDPHTCIYVAVDDQIGGDAVVGLAMASLSESDASIGEVFMLYVDTNYQRQGIGRRLVQAIAAHLAPQGISTIHIGVLANNAPARAFYEAIGGQMVLERMFNEEGYLLPETVYAWTDIEQLINVS